MTEHDGHHGWRVHAWGTAPVWELLERPEPGPGDVLVEVEACGVGLTVLNCIRGDLADDPELVPRVPGHELVGRVAALGPGVPDDLLGQRVAAYFYLSCGRCLACSSGQQSLCEQLAGWVGVHRDGGYAPYTVLPALNAVVVPDGLDPVPATVAPDAIATPLHVAERAAITPRDRVVVIGAAGGVGAHMVQVARLCGAEVAGFEVGDAKLALIEELGARAVASDDIDAIDPTTLWPGGRPSVVIDLLGSDESLHWSVDALGTGGRLVVLTTFRDRQLALDPRELVFRELTLVGSRYASRAQVRQAMELLGIGALRPVLGEVAAPPDVLGLHAKLESGELLGRAAIDWSR